MTRWRILLGIGLTASLLAGAPVGPVESLVENSPFLPPGYQSGAAQPAPSPAMAPPAASRYALTGVTTHDGVLRISLRKKGERRGRWLQKGESLEGGNLRFVRFDEAAMVALVETVNGTEVIPLKKPRIIPIPQARPPTPPGLPEGVAPRTESAEEAGGREPAERPNVPVRRRVIQPSSG